MNKRVLVIVTALVVVCLVGASLLNQRQYMRAVREDARHRGFPPESIRYPAHWPLDFYETRVTELRSLEDAEKLFAGADSVNYFLAPANNGGVDSLLTQVFFFTIGPRTNAVQLHFAPHVRVQIEGTDWRPSGASHVTRERAVAWCHGRCGSDAS
jgi:hypothetical protein